jgi:hypothetical protein
MRDGRKVGSIVDSAVYYLLLLRPILCCYVYITTAVSVINTGVEMYFREHIFNVGLNKCRLKNLSKSALNRKWLVPTFA